MSREPPLSRSGFGTSSIWGLSVQDGRPPHKHKPDGEGWEERRAWVTLSPSDSRSVGSLVVVEGLHARCMWYYTISAFKSTWLPKTQPCFIAVQDQKWDLLTTQHVFVCSSELYRIKPSGLHALNNAIHVDMMCFSPLTSTLVLSQFTLWTKYTQKTLCGNIILL